MTWRVAVIVVALCAATANLGAQNPLQDARDAIEIRYSRGQPDLNYVLRVSPQDTAGFDVEIHIRNAPDTFRLAMMMHPEYDDRY